MKLQGVSADKLSSLEEGPIHQYPETVIKTRIAPLSHLERCIQMLKLIFYFELILLIGWIGCLYLSNYYGSPSTVVDLPHKDSNFMGNGDILNADDFNMDNIPSLTEVLEANQLADSKLAETSTTEKDDPNWVDNSDILNADDFNRDNIPSLTEVLVANQLADSKLAETSTTEKDDPNWVDNSDILNADDFNRDNIPSLTEVLVANQLADSKLPETSTTEKDDPNWVDNSDILNADDFNGDNIPSSTDLLTENQLAQSKLAETSTTEKDDPNWVDNSDILNVDDFNGDNISPLAKLLKELQLAHSELPETSTNKKDDPNWVDNRDILNADDFNGDNISTDLLTENQLAQSKLAETSTTEEDDQARSILLLLSGLTELTDAAMQGINDLQKDFDRLDDPNWVDNSDILNADDFNGDNISPSTDLLTENQLAQSELAETSTTEEDDQARSILLLLSGLNELTDAAMQGVNDLQKSLDRLDDEMSVSIQDINRDDQIETTTEANMNDDDDSVIAIETSDIPIIDQTQEPSELFGHWITIASNKKIIDNDDYLDDSDEWDNWNTKEDDADIPDEQKMIDIMNYIHDTKYSKPSITVKINPSHTFEDRFVNDLDDLSDNDSDGLPPMQTLLHHSEISYDFPSSIEQDAAPSDDYGIFDWYTKSRHDEDDLISRLRREIGAKVDSDSNSSSDEGTTPAPKVKRSAESSSEESSESIEKPQPSASSLTNDEVTEIFNKLLIKYPHLNDLNQNRTHISDADFENIVIRLQESL